MLFKKELKKSSLTHIEINMFMYYAISLLILSTLLYLQK